MNRLLLATVLATAARLVLTQEIPVAYPRCAQPCLDDLTYPSEAGCKANDSECLCRSPEYINMVACCMASKCDAASLETSYDTAEDVCLTWNVHLTIGRFDRSKTCEEVPSPSASAAASEQTEESSSGSGSSKKNKSITKSKKKGKKTFGVAGIAGIAVAGVAVVGLLLFAIIFCLKKRRDQKKGAYASVTNRNLDTAPFLAAGGGGGFTDKGPQAQVRPLSSQSFQPPQYTGQAYEPYSSTTPAPHTAQPQQAYAQYGVPQAPTPQPQTLTPHVAHPSVPEMQGAEVNRSPSPVVSPLSASAQPSQGYYGQFPGPGSGQRPSEVP